MSRKKTLWIFSISLLVLALVVAGGVRIYHRLRAFSVEDGIHSTFYPLARALYRYQDEHGRPADSLAALIPQYLGAIPSSTLADSPTYRISATGDSWELTIHSSALSRPRLYICRSTQYFSPEETHRIILQYHNTWTVFPADS